MKLTLLLVTAAVVVGVATGGRFGNLARVRIRAPFLAPIGLALQMAPVPGHVLGLTLLYLSFALLLAFALMNIRVPGGALILVGLVLNLLVIAWNGGMPVTRHALAASGQWDTLSLLVHDGGAKHHLASPGDGLLPLADVIPIGWGIDQAVSVGDIATHLGIAWLIAASLRRGRPRSLWEPARTDRMVAVNV